MQKARVQLDKHWVDVLILPSGQVILDSFHGATIDVLREAVTELVNLIQKKNTLGGYEHPYFKDAHKGPKSCV